MNKTVKLFGVSLGIFVCYFYYGILQEAITKGKYLNENDESEPFIYTLSLVFFQCIVNYIYAIIILKYISPEQDKEVVGTKSDEKSKNEQSLLQKYFATCSLTYLLAMVTSNMALQWVSYPTQVVGKSCKPIPVMLLGVLIGGRSYKLRKYLFITLIVIGVGLFIYKKKPGKETSVDTSTIFGYGELLLIMSLAMDGLTGAIQERMRKHSISPGYMMKMINFFSIIYLLIALLLTGELFTFPLFVNRHPEILFKFVTFSLASAFGQFFIFIMVTDFGPLPCSIVTTTRKFFTVLGSVLFFGNVLTPLQWYGATLVFVGLFCDSIWK